MHRKNIPSDKIILLLVSMLLAGGCAAIFLRQGFPQTDGEIHGLPLKEAVEVIRDPYGIPHIYAQNDEDLMAALGFVHAQDRLWQMEIFRRLATGRLSEISGETTLELDYWMRLLDLPRLRRELAERIDAQQLPLARAYIGGINTYLEQNRENLPLEFQQLDFIPEPWQLEDLFNMVVVNAWFLESDFNQELVVLASRSKVDRAALDTLLPSSPGARLPVDGYFEALRPLRIGPLLPAVDAMYSHASTYKGVGSNNWVVRNGPQGKPLLANDPHLALMSPGIWYFCHLEAPGYRAAGASMAGVPGIVIGHNDHVAWGWTNVMIDTSDLYVFRMDPQQPENYLVQGRSLRLETREVVFQLPDGRRITRPIYTTIHGPVITEVGPEYNAVVAFKWYSTVATDKINDQSAIGFFKLNRATSVAEGLAAGQYFKLVGQNLVMADTEGNIGWHAFGAVPVRRGYSGRLPADGSAGQADWVDFLPYDQMPSAYNPAQGWIATANQRTVGDDASHPISFSWCAPYRYERISQILARSERPTPKDFRRLQMDVHSLQADRLIPKLRNYPINNQKARAALSLLAAWDHEVTADSIGAAVYEVFLSEWTRELLADELGTQLSFYYHVLPLAYLAHDVILDQPQSPLWDRLDTPERETAEQILSAALERTVIRLQELMGADTRKWQWGRIHQYYFAHLGANSALTHRLLSRGPYPAGGDNTTVNAACFDPHAGDFGVIAIPSLRLIAPLYDLGQATISGPIGQSAQPGHRHYDDMIPPWLTGEGVPLFYHRTDVERHAEERLKLYP